MLTREVGSFQAQGCFMLSHLVLISQCCFLVISKWKWWWTGSAVNCSTFAALFVHAGIIHVIPHGSFEALWAVRMSYVASIEIRLWLRPWSVALVQIMSSFNVTGLRNSLDCQQTTQISTHACAVVTKDCTLCMLADRRMDCCEGSHGASQQQITNKAIP